MIKMAKNEKKTITINDKEYDMSTFTNEEVVMYNHIKDLRRKLDNALFNVDQLRVGQDAFIRMLVNSLETPQEVKEAS
jgi:cytochrome b involved in lipid metabolism